MSHVSPVAERVSAKAPDFTLPAEDGTLIRLADVLGHGPVLLLFYRGDWCSYCNAQLANFALHHRELRELGVAVLAISVDNGPAGAALKSKLRFPFPVLSDPTHGVVDRYAGVQPRPRNGRTIGKPATFLLDREGQIVWHYIGEDPADRPLIHEILERVRAAA